MAINNKEETVVDSETGVAVAGTNNDSTDGEIKGETIETAPSEHSIFDTVIETVASAVETVSTVVSEGVTSVVAAVSGSADVDSSESKTTSHRAEKVGVVSSDKMTKTVVVRVDRVVKHPVYRKYIKRRKKFMAHDETGATIGDKVRIVETRPLSAQKRWRVIEIIQKAEK